ncbi:hypothetical protein PN36_16755 [Candidatus Thiomargarita nelsonii]|uniref:Putative restriction endonuclease domain-containing protein n=1 Tax=Candidatus Thiomargarita nelsonii TaxID=1003181 RepID=A0A0A6PDZ1_9GAMM|nr:hypothetical protein PN36_16755 [Candidatus Thiomargarita nelsonii]
MSDSNEIENNGIDGEDNMGSLCHGLTQANIACSLKQTNKNLAVLTELSLDISQHDLSEYRLGVKNEVKPDVCAYLELPTVPDEEVDLISVSQMPELAIEILSPRQAISYLIRKIKAYFALGVKSCWLVNPATKSVTVYSQPKKSETFGMSVEMFDNVMDIRLPVTEIFS